MKSVRNPAVAGLFYLDSATGLRDEIEHYTKLAKTKPAGQHVTGLVAPHAGYVYSGLTAAYAYNTIKGNGFKTVIVLSPSHHEFFHGISVYNGDAYRTPLGDVPVNKELRDFLTEDGENIFNGTRGHGREHAVEVQLPFLQATLGQFDFVPVVMGEQSAGNINLLARKLSLINSPDVLIVASSDLSHYYPRSVADNMDGLIEQHVNAYAHEQLGYDLEHKICEACGGGLIVAMMQALYKDGSAKMETLYRTDSGAVSGDTSEVVGYLSAAIYQ